MYLLPTLLASLAAAYFYVPDFLDIPIGLMTFRSLGAQFAFVGCVAVALAGFSKSVEKDPFWPWNRRFRVFVARIKNLF